ncbi:MAG: DUF3108 domain-containing protein [Pyrinomonadaceae bacterium]
MSLFSKRARSSCRFLLVAAISFFSLYSVLPIVPVAGQADTAFKVGERLTYTVGFEKFTNVAYAELYTVSRGKIGDVEAVELRSRVKTLDFMSAAFYLVDEARTVFASPETGAPLYVSRTRYVGGLPRESIQNNLVAPTGNFDLLTMIYKIRHSEGSGAFNIFEGDKVHTVTFQTIGAEKVKTDLGEFETTQITIQCDYFAEIGIREVRVNLGTGEAKIPVAVKFKTAKGEFRAKLASIQNMEPQVDPLPSPSPINTPRPVPSPTATPRAYIENQPLPPDLPFDLGETLEYQLSAGGQPVSTLVLRVAERKQVNGVDSLLLSAVVTDSSGAPFAKGDGITGVVDPETLGPRSLDIKVNGALAAFNESVMFDERTNTITFKGTGRVEAPVGTHSILSLAYAIRSFNLKPSKDTSNPINDTRVAVFWDSRPYIFTLRPSNADMLNVQGEKVSAQMISISTGNPELDSLGLKVWLSNDERRVPLRFVAGRFQADLVSDKVVPVARPE